MDAAVEPAPHRPLHGLTIVELPAAHAAAQDAGWHDGADDGMGVLLATSLAGRIAADLGAAVLKIEPAAGDPLRRVPPFVGGTSALFAFLNAGKRSVVLPGADAEPALRRLLARADGLLGPDDARGTAAFAALGADAGPATPRAAALVSLAGPDGGPASEFTVLALSGLLHMVGEPERAPLRLGGHQVAYAAGLAAFAGLVGGLVAGARDAATPEVARVSLLENAVWMNWKNLSVAATGGTPPQRVGRGADWPVVRCADGWVVLVYQDAEWALLRELAGNDPRLDDPGLATVAGRRARGTFVPDVIEQGLRGKTRADIHAFALRHRIPLGPVMHAAELAADPHMLARAFLAAVAAPGGMLRVPRLPVLWNGRAFLPGAVPALQEQAA